MQKSSLECRNIGLERGGRLLFSGLSFALEEGELLVLQGANGSGKSSLLRCLSGIVKVAEGEVCYNDTPIEKNPDYQQSLLYLGHAGGLYADLTVEAQIRFWAKLYGHAELAGVALHYFDLAQYAHVACRRLSAGWRKRVSLARLICAPRRLWYLDEPTVNLDAKGLALFEALLGSRLEQGGMVVMATHSAVNESEVKTIKLN